MNRILAVCLSVTLLAAVSCGGKKTAAPESANGGSTLTLDAAIAAAADQIDSRIDGGVKIAIVNFTSPSDAFSTYVIDELTANLVETQKLSVIDRREIDRIREEMQFQISGEVDDESIQELGRLLGAQYIVSGSYTSLGDMHRVVIRALTVQTAAIIVQYRGNVGNDKVIASLLSSGKASVPGSDGGPTTRARHAKGNGSASSNDTKAAKAKEDEVQYKIGDTGPAGGLIFFDKGNNKGGWRYLEAAPTGTEQSAQWAGEGNTVPDNVYYGLKSDAGSGKPNTEDLMALFATIGGGFGWAAQVCDELEVNGFDDWFLPSVDELNQMYGVLHRKGLGGFRDVSYWSSSPSGGRGHPYTLNFSDASRKNEYWGTKHRVRAARRF